MMNSLSGGDPHDGDPRLDLSPRQCAELFPFHIIFDRSMRVQAVGSSLAKIASLRPGDDLRQYFALDRPNIGFQFDLLAANRTSMYLLRSQSEPLTLRGQLMGIGPDRMAFLGSPWVPEPGGLRKLELRLTDFPLHDSMPELVNVVQSQRLAMDDLKRLTEKLRAQRQSLRETLEQLKIRERESRRLGLIAASTDNGVIVTDAKGCIEWVNESFEKLTGYQLEEVRGKTPGSILQGPGTDPATVAYMREQLRAGQGFHCEVVNYSKSGRRFWLSIEVQPIVDETGTITNFMAIDSDVTERKEFEVRSRLAYSVTRILAEADDPMEAVGQVLAVIAEGLQCRFGALWRVDEERGEIYCQKHWADPGLRGSDFEKETVGRRFVKGTGLPGEVWESNAPVIQPDFGTATNFLRVASARRGGLRNGFAFPIRLGGRVRGIMEFLGDLPERPSAGMLETLVGLGAHLEQVMQRLDAEQQRSEILSLLDSTIESTAEGIMVTDLEGRLLRVNRRWLELWSIPETLVRKGNSDEIIGWVDDQLEEPEARRATRQESFEHPETMRTQILRLKDGRDVELVTVPHRVAGQISGLVLTYRDVTEARQSQRVRDELLATLNATLEATADGIFVADLNGAVITVNHRFLELWRVTASDVQQWRGPDLGPAVAAQLANVESFGERVAWLCAHPEESGFDVVHLRDGRVFEQHTQAQREGVGVTGRVWSYRDVTERWRSDQALRESEERYRVLMHTATDAILTVDERGRVVFASRSAGRLFGYAPEALPGMLVWRLVPPEDRAPATVLQLMRGGRKGGSRTSEVAALRKDGSRLPVEISLHRARIGGRKFVTGILRDITQRKAAEKQLQQAIQAANYANRAKSDFLANISHEMRTPLNSIIGLTELLRKSQVDVGEQEEILASVWASSESLLYLINDLLDLSKIEAGQMDIESEEVDVHALGEQVIDILRLRAARKQLALFFVVDPASPPRFQGDANRIRQILVNLMGNAIKFTERGSVTLRFEWGNREDTTIAARFVVADTGIGISAEDQEKVFGKFFRVNIEAGRRADGAGLGLSISRLLCEAMGGQLSVTSTVGAGSRFAVDLPLGTTGTPSDGELVELRTLLLAAKEDEGQIRPVLASAGLDVDSFFDVSAATAHADQSMPYDLLVLDEFAIADAEQVRLLLRLSMLGKELRWIRIRRPASRESTEIALPGQGEELESPFTPARVQKTVALLFGRPDGKRAVASQTGIEKAGPLSGGALVLLVEDNPDSQAYALRVLSRAGHRTGVAATGAEAIAEAQRKSYDVILMDLMLPDMTGFEATRAIRNDEARLKRSRVPVVALTAHALQDYREGAFAAEMDDYVTKPVRPQSLLNVVKTWAMASRVMEAENEEVTVDADLADLIPGYLERVSRQLGEIREHAEEGRVAEAARLAHMLKGNGDSYGFRTLTQAGGEMEQAALAGEAQKVLDVVRAVSDWLARVKWKPANPS